MYLKLKINFIYIIYYLILSLNKEIYIKYISYLNFDSPSDCSLYLSFFDLTKKLRHPTHRMFSFIEVLFTLQTGAT